MYKKRAAANSQLIRFVSECRKYTYQGMCVFIWVHHSAMTAEETMITMDYGSCTTVIFLSKFKLYFKSQYSGVL